MLQLRTEKAGNKTALSPSLFEGLSPEQLRSLKRVFDEFDDYVTFHVFWNVVWAIQSLKGERKEDLSQSELR